MPRIPKYLKREWALRENGRSFLIYSLEFISFLLFIRSYYKVCYNKIYYERLNCNEESKMPNTQS